MIYIYQVAGIPEQYQKKEFVIDGKGYKSCLCSDAFKQYLTENGAKVKHTIFIPESLARDIESFCLKLNSKGIYDFEAVLIPSVGKFGDTNFIGKVENIATAIFLHFIKAMPDEFYVDVTTGFNIYPVNLLEAAKRYLTYRKLGRIIQGDYPVKAYTLFSPPILREIESYKVEVQPIDVKVFFSLPNANVDKIVETTKHGREVGDINKRYVEVKKRFKLLFNDLKIAYNAIRFNVPLAFYQILKFDKQVDETEIVKLVEDFIKPILKDREVERMDVDGVNVSNIFYAVALYKSIQEFVKSLREPTVDEILERFSKLYKIEGLGIGVNEYFLQRDVEEIKEVVEKALKDGRIFEEILYGKLKHGDKFYKSKVAKRNFFAHSGFLLESTLLKIENGKIYVRWVEDNLREFTNWLKKPEK